MSIENSILQSIETDLQDSSIVLYSSNCRSLEIRIFNGMITLAGEDFGEECYKMSGKRVYEFYYSLKEEQTRHFLEELRAKYGIEKALSEILMKEFGCDEGSVKFREYCEKIGESPAFFCF